MELNIPEHYFEDEVRDGFYVDGMMKRCWASQLEVLNEIDKVCKKLGVRWFADCGTLLGAVRHEGYIPWDDDMDICMLRDDYDRFRTNCRELLPKDYLLLYYDKEESTGELVWDLLLRVTNSNRLSDDPEFLKKYHDFPFISGVDIFPIDYMSPNDEEEELRRNLGIIVREAAYSEDIGSAVLSPKTQMLVDNVEKAFNMKFDPRFRQRQIFGLLERVFSMYGKKGAKHVALMPYWISEHDHKYELSWFDDIIQLPFEFTTINVPAAYDAVLRTEYGDYISIYRSGGVHEYPYYSKQYEYIKTAQGKPLFTYYFDKTDLDIQRPEPKPDVKKQILDYLEVLFEAHEQIALSAEAGNYGLALDLLAQAQDGAVNVGTTIEGRCGEGFVSVGFLESYCESVFNVHSLISGFADESETGQSDGAGLSNIREELDLALNKAKESIISDYPGTKKEVVFLPYSSSHWEKFEALWRKADEDPDVNAVVIPIPYYDRALNGEATALHFEPGEYPDYISITDFNDYNFLEKQPDTIYIQMAHDEFHPTMMTHPFFFASNLRRFTAHLVYVPPFEIDEIEEDDVRGRLSLDYFVKKPGVVIADETLVSSESIRQSYIDALTELSGEEYKEVWEKKIRMYGTGLYEKEASSRMQDVPEEWKKKLFCDDGSRKKAILYRTTLADVVEHQEDMIKKMRSVFDIFRESQNDVCLVWRPDNNVRNVLRRRSPRDWGGYRDLMEQIKKEDWAIVDETRDPQLAAGICDAYYGDRDRLVIEFQRAGKPVMIEDVNV